MSVKVYWNCFIHWHSFYTFVHIECLPIFVHNQNIVDKGHLFWTIKIMHQQTIFKIVCKENGNIIFDNPNIVCYPYILDKSTFVNNPKNRLFSTILHYFLLLCTILYYSALFILLLFCTILCYSALISTNLHFPNLFY